LRSITLTLSLGNKLFYIIYNIKKLLSPAHLEMGAGLFRKQEVHLTV
jgi:hypothetical protein